MATVDSVRFASSHVPMWALGTCGEASFKKIISIHGMELKVPARIIFARSRVETYAAVSATASARLDARRLTESYMTDPRREAPSYAVEPRRAADSVNGAKRAEARRVTSSRRLATGARRAEAVSVTGSSIADARRTTGSSIAGVYVLRRRSLLGATSKLSSSRAAASSLSAVSLEPEAAGFPLRLLGVNAFIALASGGASSVGRASALAPAAW